MENLQEKNIRVFIKTGKRNGYGVLYLRNGDVYEGEFKENKQSGQGKYFLKVVLNTRVNLKIVKGMDKVNILLKMEPLKKVFGKNNELLYENKPNPTPSFKF